MRLPASPKLFGTPCWVFPILAGLAWLVTLLAILIEWIVKGSPHYPEMWPSQHLSYISNAGASDWGHPLFISGATITAIFFSITFISERWLRHKGKLLHSATKWSSVCWVAAAVLTATATCALVLFTIFCVRRHAVVHYTLVATFALGYILAAALLCAERKHLCNTFPTRRILHWSLRIKLFFIAVELLFVILGSVTMYQRMYRTSVVVEWLAALFFSFYMASFAVDFFAVPAVDDEKENAWDLMMRSWDEDVGITRPQWVYGALEKRYSLLE
ncbi:Frag1/DRAM/Sfk1 family-domain-containing protein [Neohortaea acidophila]|uniref:Frag1/DRAM/Sfk1 family-domain-containing protein n=1 Tax=Neohortaea acidophila TaxID=245834 RepID=A0A6A6PSV4_9PEZI|nr:Frag1/DRAM/Sfk1 family-domain-containing protein [Neohortaea acidophila]KAF2482307.1 Frag1/DRAM/Sfk1 family-domain-containing protein [Neohortaea acidophila]